MGLVLLAAALDPITHTVPGLSQGPTSLVAQEASSGGADVFRRFSPSVGRVEVTETRSAAKSSIGSAWFVGPGLLISNYHVVAEFVREPDDHELAFTDAAGQVRPLTLLAVDAPNDLALLRTEDRGDLALPVAVDSLPHGTRLYALGYPRDIGLSIVEGTYNGLARATLAPRVHFTGSLNPGMSGGPAITDGGVVIGVNVSTAGDQLSFLVPGNRVTEFVRGAEVDEGLARDLMLEVVATLDAFQADYLERIGREPFPTVTLDDFVVPTGPAVLFDCWGDSQEDEDERYVTLLHACVSNDQVYLQGSYSTSVVELTHTAVRSSGLNRFQLNALLTDEFQSATGGSSSDETTGYVCDRGNVRGESLVLRTVLCTRTYRKLLGLYDVVFRSVTLGGTDRGLISELRLSGVDFDRSLTLVRSFAEALGVEP